MIIEKNIIPNTLLKNIIRYKYINQINLSFLKSFNEYFFRLERLFNFNNEKKQIDTMVAAYDGSVDKEFR